MSITVSFRAIKEYEAATAELDQLTSNPALTGKKYELRYGAAIARASLAKEALKKVSSETWRKYEREKLLAEAGMLRDPEMPQTRFDQDVEAEYRRWIKGEPVRMTHIPTDSLPETRANLAGTQSITGTETAIGGAFVPLGIYERAFESMRQYDEVFDSRFSNIIETKTGATTTFPSWDDVTNSAVLVGETQQSSEVDVARFGNVQLGTYTFRSEIANVSLELLQDSEYPIGPILERVFAGRLARGIGKYLITGSGANQPTGLLTGAIAAGAQIVVASGAAVNDGGAETGANSISTQDLVNVYGKIDKIYRNGACWFMADATLQSFQSLLNKYGSPILEFRKGYHDSVTDETPYLLGKPVAVCPSMPAMSSAQNSVVFGNPFYFLQRRVPSSVFLRRFTQNISAVLYGEVSYEMWMRVDSNVVAPNSSYVPFSILQQHS